MTLDKPTVLFVCVHNAGRSQIAAGYLSALAGDEVRVWHIATVAFVFGLTGKWRPEWGGLLLFHDRAGEVERGLVPGMNALTLFRVPRVHSVSLVAPFAPAPRAAVSGWLNGPAGTD